jgi:hypothetical protein
MLIIVQFPIADGRLFRGFDRHTLPLWNTLKEDKDFIQRFGGARVQRDFETMPSAWRDDAQYVSARWAIRLVGTVEKRNLSDIGATAPRQQPFWVYRPENAATDFCFTPAFRRLFSDGIGLTRIDIGFWVFGGNHAISGTDVLYLVRDVLELETEVQQLTGSAERNHLRHQAGPLKTLYYLSTRTITSAGKDQELEASLVHHGVPVVFVDDRMRFSDMPRKPQWFVPMARFLVGPAAEWRKPRTILQGKRTQSIL